MAAVTAAPPPRPLEFIKSLGLADVALMVVVAVVSLRWIPRAAGAGWLSLSLWTLAALLFFVPLAAVVLELSTRFPEQGGLYVWVMRGFGSRHAFFCAWCLWLNQVFYFPSYLLFALANLIAIGGPAFAPLAKSRALSALLVLVLLWSLTALNIRGFEAAKWLQGLGTLGIWIPAGLLVLAVLVAFLKGPSASLHFPWRDLLPHGNAFSALALWSSMCFAFSGLEIAGLVGQEIRNPRRTLPGGLGLGAAAILLVYLSGSAAVLLLAPSGRAIDERTGIGDAIQSGAASFALGSLVLALIAFAAVATTSSWMAGAARIPYAAAVKGQLPAPLARLHPRFRTPYAALIVQAVCASLTLLISLFLDVQHQASTVTEAYDVMVNLTILVYFVPYLYLFLSPLRLPRPLQFETRSTIPGGPAGRWLAALAGLVTTAVSLVLLFVPPPGTKSIWNFETNLILQSTAVFGAGLLITMRVARSRAPRG